MTPQVHDNHRAASDLGRRLRRIALIVAAACCLEVAHPIPAMAATTREVRGTVVCRGGHAVTGVWINSSAGGSKFASFNRFAGKPHAAYYKASVVTAAATTSIRLEVGCGGTTSSWWSKNLTAYATVSGTRTLSTRCSEAAGTAQRCTWPPQGTTVSTNPGSPGNCTWGAQEQWKSRTGSYLRTSGDAGEWNTTAASYGWYVSSVPHVRSIVVFEPGSGGSGAAGHVAYVTGVTHVGSGAFDVQVIEMNANHGGGGFNKYNTWPYRHVPGAMNYIVSTL